MNPKKILAQILAPKNVIPNAMSIQSHQPDHIIFLRTHFPGGTVVEDSSHNRLFAWLGGGEALISEYKDLKEPFPIPYTSPKGYFGKMLGNSPTYEIIDLSTTKIKDRLISLQHEHKTNDLNFDLLPGAKSVKIPLLISTNHWKMWYTLESGISIHCTSKFQIETHEGLPLSLIDRSWLGGNPVLVDRHFSRMPEEGELELHRHISETLELEPPSGNIGDTTRLNRPKTVNGDGFKEKLENLGYSVNITTPKNRDKDCEERDMIISNGIHQVSFKYLNEVGSDSGFYLEPLIEAKLWGSEWNPIETVLGMEIYEHSGHERKLKIIRQFSHLQRMWTEIKDGAGGDSSTAARFEWFCNEVNLIPSEDLDLNELVTKILEDTKMAAQELPMYMMVCELDVLMLDSHGIVCFDGKTVVQNYDPLTFATKRPQWLMYRQEYIVIPLSLPPKKFEKEPNIIHFDQIQFGRDVLDNPNRCYPLPCLEIERAQSFFFENQECSQPGISFRTIHKFEYNKKIKVQELVSKGAHIEICDADNYDFLSACKKLGHLDCKVFQKHPLSPLYTNSYFEISYNKMGVRIAKSSNNKILFYTPKALSSDDIGAIILKLKEKAPNDNDNHDWPDWTRDEKTLKKLKLKNIRLIITDEEIDQPGLFVIETYSKKSGVQTSKLPSSATKEELIRTISDALLEIVPCEWPFVSRIINTVSTKSERLEHFGMKGAASQKMAKKFLSDYFKFEGVGTDMMVHRAHPIEEE